MVLYSIQLPGRSTVISGVGANPAAIFERRILVPGRVLDLIECDRHGIDLGALHRLQQHAIR